MEVHFAFSLVELRDDEGEGDLVLYDAHHVFELRLFEERFSLDEFFVPDFYRD